MTCWYYDKDELQKTPSIQDGITYKTECRFRMEGTRFIMDIGSKMDLGYNTLATGAVYFHRFYMFHSFKTFPRYVGACGCLFLAGKAEETPKKCKDIIKVVKDILDEDNFADFGPDPKEVVLSLEKVLLQTMKFDLKIQHPYTYLLKYAKCLKGKKRKLQKMVQMAWTFINDSLCTTLAIQWEPEIIAIAVMYLAGKLTQFRVVDWGGRRPNQKYWWDVFVEELNLSVIEDICHQVLDLYSPIKEQESLSMLLPSIKHEESTRVICHNENIPMQSPEPVPYVNRVIQNEKIFVSKIEPASNVTVGTLSPCDTRRESATILVSIMEPVFKFEPSIKLEPNVGFELPDLSIPPPTISMNSFNPLMSGREFDNGIFNRRLDIDMNDRDINNRLQNDEMINREFGKIIENENFENNINKRISNNRMDRQCFYNRISNKNFYNKFVYKNFDKINVQGSNNGFNKRSSGKKMMLNQGFNTRLNNRDFANQGSNNEGFSNRTRHRGFGNNTNKQDFNNKMIDRSFRDRMNNNNFRDRMGRSFGNRLNDQDFDNNMNRRGLDMSRRGFNNIENRCCEKGVDNRNCSSSMENIDFDNRINNKGFHNATGHEKWDDKVDDNTYEKESNSKDLKNKIDSQNFATAMDEENWDDEIENNDCTRKLDIESFGVETENQALVNAINGKNWECKIDNLESKKKLIATGSEETANDQGL